MFDSVLANRERHRPLFGEMLRRFELDDRDGFSLADGTVLRQAAAACLACKRTEECAAWLAFHRGRHGAEAFCPNAPRFSALAGTA